MRFIISLIVALIISTGIKSAIYAATEPVIEVIDATDPDYAPPDECADGEEC